MKNTGKSSERDFESRLDALGKRAYYTRLVDAAEVVGRTGRIGFSRSQPSDYVVTLHGNTFYAEVKSTVHEKLFQFSLLRTSQSGAAIMILGAGGEYWIFLHHLLTGNWYRIPYRVVFDAKQNGRASLSWIELEDYLYDFS